MSESEATNLQPLGSRVLLKVVEADNRTASGLLLPESAKEKPQVGIIVAVGDDEEMKLKVGDKVLFAKYSGTEIKHHGVDYLVMESNDILLRFAE